ncbi:hypothetical protein FF1_037262 [Malus domestica]
MEANVLLQTYARTLVVLNSGKGCKLYDTEWCKYLDLSSTIAVNVLGHGDEEWLKAMVDQAETLSHVSNLYYSIPQRHAHPDAKEPATGFISFTNSFHGRTMGALALTSKEHYRSPFGPVMPGVTFVEYGNI